MTYIVRKKGGRNRKAHVNRLKFFDPMNSLEDPTVHISIEEDEPDNEEHNDPTNHEGQQHDKDQAIAPSQSPGHKRVTRSKTNSLPTPIQRYAAAAALNQDKNRKKENDWASEELKQSLRQLHILP